MAPVTDKVILKITNMLKNTVESLLNEFNTNS